MLRLTRSSCAAATALFVAGAAARAQQPTQDSLLVQARGAFTDCSGAIAAGRVADAQQPAARASRLFRTFLAQQPSDIQALIGLARTLTECLIPAVDLEEQGQLSDEAITHLERALKVDSLHWGARFVLASIYYFSPEFLERSGVASVQFDELLRQQGNRTENPLYARSFEYRGALWMRRGNADSARAGWARGARLFPGDSALRALTAPRPPGGAIAVKLMNAPGRPTLAWVPHSVRIQGIPGATTPVA